MVVSFIVGTIIGFVGCSLAHAATGSVESTANFKYISPSKVEAREYVEANCPENWRWMKINGQDIKVCKR
tara:strand:- start:87 stop:296 length:210 start_codon:yes stop_codon:yes gene_type:complete